MNTTRTIETIVLLSAGDVISALRAVHPGNIELHSLPMTGQGVEMTLVGAQVLQLKLRRKPVETPSTPQVTLRLNAPAG